MRITPSLLAFALPVALTGLASACATHAPPTPPVPVAAAPRGLPPIPEVEGALRLDVVAPGEGEALPTRDSTFVYGSVGTGGAELTVNGAPVKVEPNGSFLAWLPVPPDGVYHLAAAAAGAQRATLDRRVRLPEEAPALPRERARILEGTMSPAGTWVVQPGERVDVSFRGSPGGRATLVLPDGTRIPLVESAASEEVVQGAAEFGGAEPAAPRTLAGVSTYRGFMIATPLVAAEDVAVPRLTGLPTVAAPVEAAQPRKARAKETAKAKPSGKGKGKGRGHGEAKRRESAARAAEPGRFRNGLTDPRAAGAAVLELVSPDGDTARTPLPLTVAVLERPRVGVAFQPIPPDQTHRAEVVGRAATSGPYNWFWPNGTRLALTGERGGMLRVDLTGNRSAWVSASEVRLLPEGTPPPFSPVGAVRFDPQPGWIDARFALRQQIPFRVDETLSSITVMLYGAQSQTDFMQYGGADPLIRYAEWRQLTDSIYTLTVNLSQSVWGYRAYYAPGGNLVLRIRRPPRIDPGQPLRGLGIALDPGHPPGGAVGPTRLAERDANLGIALKLRPLLEAAGASVLMTRTTDLEVPLNARPQMAVDANVDILLSIHNNGLPNGVNPFGNTGTSDYYFNLQAAELAQDLDREIVQELRTQDLGPGRADLALVRPTWMPAVLTETMFLMVPIQEAALRNADVQQRIAEAHLRGLLDFLRARARQQTESVTR